MSIDDVLRSHIEQLAADAGVPPELLEGPQSAEVFRDSRRAYDSLISDRISHQMLHVGEPRTFSATEYVSAQIPCNQRHCSWTLDTEWRDPAAPFPGWAWLPTALVEALLRDHFERQHGIPVIPGATS